MEGGGQQQHYYQRWWLCQIKPCKAQQFNHEMKSQKSRPESELQTNNYRQSVSILASELIRHSFAGDCQAPNIYRESISSPTRHRTSLNLEIAQQILQGIEKEKKERDKAQLSNLKTTLSDLQKKINKAKHKLNTFSHIIGEESDEEGEDRETVFDKTPTKYEDATTVGSSMSKACFSQPVQEYPKIKTYYLANLAGALDGKNKRALDHLNVSLKVLKNYYKIESPTFGELEQKKVNLPKDKADLGKKTLLIDIDETILHCEEDDSKSYDLALPIEIEGGATANAYITIRPYAISFLKRMSKLYQIIAFTASHESYADVVLDELDPTNQYIKHRLYRKNCIEIHENIYAKDLRIINRDLSSMVLLDNAPYSYIFQLENGIPILPFYRGEDNELAVLEKYLEQMAKCQDVREFNKTKFKLHSYCNFSDAEEMVKELYFKETSRK